MKKSTAWIFAVACTAAACGGTPIRLVATNFVRATGNPSLVTWAKGSAHVPVWSLSGGQVGQSIAALTPPIPSDCTAVRVEMQVVNEDASATNTFTDVYRAHIAQVKDGQPLDMGATVGKPVRARLSAPWKVRTVVLESYRKVTPGLPLSLRIQREPDDPGDTFTRPAGLISVTVTPLDAPAPAFVVQDVKGYNSWPMIQAVSNRLVCTYSRGSGHLIGEGTRDAYARVSTDGGRTWSPEVCFAADPNVGEVMIGKGTDLDGAALFWVRCMGRPRSHHDLYRTMDGVKFEKIAEPSLDPFPMQITDVFKLPGGKLMSLWFATNYRQGEKSSSWGTLTSVDNGRTWTQKTVETGLEKGELPTEQSAVYLGGGRILAIARTENGGASTASQFQLMSADDGATWTRVRTNIRDVQISTPSLILDAERRLVYNYYYERGRGVIKRRVARVDDIWNDPLSWPDGECVAIGNEERPHDAGNVNAVVFGGRHYLAYYSGTRSDTTVFVATAALRESVDGASVRRPMALLVMLDGARADAIDAARMPAVQSVRDGTWAPGYAGAWSLFGQNVPDARPSSAANHTAILTGVNAAKSRVFNNGQTKDGDYAHWPTWLMRVTENVPGTKGLFIFSWGEGNQYPRAQNVQFIHDKDANNGKNIAKILASPDAPDAIQYFIDLPDHGGHSAGFYPFAMDYLHSLYTSDTYIAGALAAIRSRPTFKDEDWLVMVTADHGGYARSHGMWGGQASTIPVILSGRNIPSGRLVGAPRHYDLTATALAHFGLDPVALDLDGRPLAKTAKDSPRPLKDGLATYLAAGGKPLGIRKVEGSDKLAFENGGDFAVTLWARLPAKQAGDPLIFSNKDWRSGANPGIALVASKATDGVKVPGVCLNAGRPDKGRIDLGTFDIEPGQWVFYAVVRNSEGVIVVYQGRADGRFNWLCAPAADIIVKSGLPFCIGQDGTGAYRCPLTGDVDDFALWIRALSHEDVRKIFDAGRQGLPLGELL